MNHLFYILFTITFVSCNTEETETAIQHEPVNEEELRNNKSEFEYQQNLWLNSDTLPKHFGEQPMTRYDSLFHSVIDTTTIKGKRDQILLNYLISSSPSGAEYDSLFDLNYDGYLDYVIGFYYQSGTGLKNGILVYLFDPITNQYLKDTLLSSIANPSFYLEDKMITGFYIPYGSGDCQELQWLDKNWQVTRRISTSSTNNILDSVYWYIEYPITRKRDSIISLYSGIPPQKILRNDYGVD